MSFKTTEGCLVWTVLALALCGCAGPKVAATGDLDRDAIALGHAPDGARADVPAGDERGDGPATRFEPIPTAAEIFDFHPPGSRPGSWREPFRVSYTEGPLNAYRVRTLAELERLRDHRLDLVAPSSLAAR